MKFQANTASEFMKNAEKKYGANTLGETSYKLGVKPYSFKAGKLEKVEFTLSIAVDYAEPGTGSPDAENKAAIAEISAMTKEHELKHKATYEDAFDDWDAKKQAKELMEKSFKDKGEADKALEAKLKEMKAALLKACLDLHSTEGIIEMKQVITVTSKPRGAGGCK